RVHPPRRRLRPIRTRQPGEGSETAGPATPRHRCAASTHSRGPPTVTRPSGISEGSLKMPTSGPERLGPDPRPLDQKFWDPQMQTMSRDERRVLQDERFTDVVRRVFERPVPLFKRKLAEGGVNAPDDIKSVDDLVNIPTTVKDDLRTSEAEHPPVGDYR